MQNFLCESFISPLIIIPMLAKKVITMDKNKVGSEHSSKEQIIENSEEGQQKN